MNNFNYKKTIKQADGTEVELLVGFNLDEVLDFFINESTHQAEVRTKVICETVSPQKRIKASSAKKNSFSEEDFEIVYTRQEEPLTHKIEGEEYVKKLIYALNIV